MAPEDPDHDPEPIWVCPNCGREHQKNSPPCSRCGNPSLERHTPDYSDLDDIGAPTYRELIEPKYVAGAGVAVVAGALLVMGLLGVGPLAGAVGQSLAVSDVPGEADTYRGVDLAAVEEGYVDALVAAQGDARRSDRLDEVARFYNQRRVKATVGDGTLPSNDRLGEAIGDACDSRPTLVPFTRSADALTGAESASAGGQALYGSAPTDAKRAAGSSVGVDVHVARGTVFVTQLTC